MEPVRVELVFANEVPSGLVPELERRGYFGKVSTATEAAEAMTSGACKLLICERVPAWQALAARAESSHSAFILWGLPPTPEERRHILSAELLCIERPNEVGQALQRAQLKINSQDAAVDFDSALWERVCSAERIGRFAQSIATQLDLPGVIREAIARTRDLCDACGASLLIVDPATGELCFDTAVGEASAQIETIRLKAGQGIAGKVAQSAEPRLIRDVTQCEDFSDSCDAQTGFSTGSIIAVPLLLGGDVLGVLEAVRRRQRVAFDDAHLYRLMDLAPHVTIAVHNAQINARLKQSQALVMQANAELEKKVAERTAQIGRAKQEWERTFDAIAEPIALQEGFILRRTNMAYARKVGLPITRIPGEKCHRLLAGRDTPCPGCPLLRGRGTDLAGEVTLPHASYDVSGFWVSGEPEDRTVVVHYRDISEQRLLQARLRETERMAALGQLASGAAHEINNPLGFLISNLGSLKSCMEDIQAGLKTAHALDIETLFEDGTAMIEESLVGAHRVGEIVKALRELSRQEITKADPASVNASITRMARAEFGEDSASVKLVLDADTPAEISPLQLDQVLGHIFRNARQATLEKGGVIIRSFCTDREVGVEVSDSGCGISSEHLHRIFEPFFTTRGVGRGVGLGLTAAYGIIRRHGGSIDVHSELEQGSTFTVRLPKAKAPNPSAAAGAA
jgi:signal transduction histidine kinase/putative methionine-R-sulfoxide reductase with GAF domain